MKRNYLSSASRLLRFDYLVLCLLATQGLLLSLNNDLFAEQNIRSNKTSPNVLLIMTDDQGFGDVTSHGNQFIETPYHDLLAKQGVRFDRFYVSPVCAPTRASLLSGRYHSRTGVHGVTRGRETMRADEVTIAEILQANGYATAAFGKWHNGSHYPQHPNGQGFEEFVGFCAGHWNNYFNTHLEHNGDPIETDGFIIDILTDHAINWIEKQNRINKPWFCYVPYNTPHTPWQVPDKYWEKYKDLDLTPEAACAYAMVENIDTNMGRLLKCIDDLNQRDNTIVIFLSDNGANTDRYNAGMRGRKGSNHEGGSRVPLFIRYPGVTSPGTVIKPIAAHIDLLPTLVELTNSKPIPTKPLDGKSLVPLLKGKTKSWPQRTLFNRWRNRGAVRTDKWRAVNAQRKASRFGRWALFDMQNDPGETTNVAAKHPEIINRMKKEYQGWLTDIEKEGFDPIPAEIGHSESPRVCLSGHEAYLLPEKTKGISYVARQGWANDYITNWTSEGAYPSWPVRVIKPGRYKVSIDYACEPDAVGSVLQAKLAAGKATLTIKQPYLAKTIPSPDRIPRKEVFEKTWKRIELGTMEITQTGNFELQLRGLSKPGKEFPEIKTIIIELVK